MKKPKSNIDIYRTAAKKLGLKSEFVQSSPKKKVLLISNAKKFFLASAAAPGFYPETRRWNAHFSGSKLLTQKIMKRLGYAVISSKEVRIADFLSSKALCKSLDKKHYNFPMLLKPDKGLMGQGIVILENIKQLHKAASDNFKKGNDFMIQPILEQNEYRILIVNGTVMVMHSKHNPCITGDGKSSIKSLLAKIPDAKKDAVFIAWQYSKLGVKPSTILEKGSQFEYHLTKKPTTNYYETKKIPSVISKWAKKIAKDISAPVIGIDVFIPGPFNDTSTYTIIELNNNPGVDYLISYCNDTKISYEIFEKVLRDYFGKQ